MNLFENGGGMMPPKTSYLYGYAAQSRQVYQPPVTERQSSSVVYDFSRGELAIERYKQNSQGKTKQTRKAVCQRFDLQATYSLSLPGESQLLGELIQYVASGITRCGWVPSADNCGTKYHKYLPGICKLPAASYAELDEVIGWMIEVCPNRHKLTLYDRQGFFSLPNGVLAFAQPLAIEGLPPKLVPESLQKRRQYQMNPMQNDADQIVEQFCQLCSHSFAMQLVGLYLASSLFLLFFPEEITRDLAFLNFVVQDKTAEDKLTAMLCTNDLSRDAVPELGIGTKKLEAELNQVYDGVAVAIDHCYADDEAAVHEGTKAILNARRSGRKLIATISDKIGCVTNQLDEGCCISVPVGSDFCADDLRTIRMVSLKMEAVLIALILQKPSEIKSEINRSLSSLKAPEDLPVSAVNTIKLLTTVEGICHGFPHYDIPSTNEFVDLLNGLFKSTDLCRTSDTLIRDEFASILSQKIRSSSFPTIQKKNRLVLDVGKKPVIVYGERLYITQELFSEILSEMQTARNRRNLVNVLKRGDVLSATDGNTHPIDAYDVAGKRIRLYCYDISAYILDADVSELLENPDAGRFFFKPEQFPDKDFLLLISRTDGRIAGRQIRYREATNNSIAVWGQSGYGKTYLMTQLIMRTAMLGHQVVVFDSSDSFSLEALCHTLPRDFIDAHIMVYDLDSSEIPVDVFRIDRSKSQESQESMLFGLIFAGLKDLSSPQSNLLRSAVEGVLAVLNPDEPIRPEDICAMLDEKSPAYRGLTSRLERLFHIIDRKGMAERTWKEFFTKDITIIRIDPSFTERGNALFDVLMASLYNAQCEDSETALTVCVDEVQQQNLAKGSAIHKILTEGRKKHMAFYGATQDYYPRNTDLGAAMGKADTQIFLKPTLGSTELVARELRLNKAEREKLDSLMRGECFIKGSLYNPDTGRNESAIIRGNITPL